MKTILTITIPLILLTLGSVVNMSNERARAQGPNAGGNLGNHHQEVELATLIGETKQLALPVANRPVFAVYSLSNIFDSTTGAAEEPANGSCSFFYDSTSNLGPESFESLSTTTGCNAIVKIRIENAMFVMETVNGTGPLCRTDIAAKLHVSFWY